MKRQKLPPTPAEWKSANPKGAAKLTKELVGEAMKLFEEDQ
jgi:hypothetical protein